MANDGDIMAALVNNEVIIRVFRKVQNKAYLEAVNPQFPTLKEFKIIGKVTASIRKYD